MPLDLNAGNGLLALLLTSTALAPPVPVLSFPSPVPASGLPIPVPIPVILAIAPQNATTTTFQEVVTVDLNRVFSDTAGTVALTSVGVGQKVGAIRDVFGNIAATFPSGAQPTFQIDSQSGNGALLFDGATTYGQRANVANAQCIAMIYAADYAGARTRPATMGLLAQPGPLNGTTNVNGYALRLGTSSGLFGADNIAFRSHKSDGTDSSAATNLVVGHTECLLTNFDGTTVSHYKSGLKDTSNPGTAGTGSIAPVAGANATLGSLMSSDGKTNNSFFKGLILGWAVSSGQLGASEIPGVSQWMVNRAAQKQTLTGWLGAYFQGDASTGETAASHNPVFKHFDAALTKSQYRPGVSPLVSSTGLGCDYGLATDGQSYYLTGDSLQNNSTIPLLKSSDGFNFKLLSSIDVSAVTGGGSGNNPYGIAPTFARNVDNTIYTDPQGCAYLFFDASPVQADGICYVKSVDNTWATGGAWGAAAVVPGLPVGSTSSSTPVNQIDPTVMRDASGVWHMAFADYKQGTGNTGGGQVRHGSCPAGLPTQTWTLDAAVDVYGVGSGCEGPQLINMGTAASPSFALLYDRTGCGFSLATLPNGLGGAIGVKSTIYSDDILEQGEVAPYLPTFPNPNLQATTTPNPNKWPGKGLLVAGDFGVLTSSRATGWGTGFNGNGGVVPVVSAAYVPDPNGQPTATRVKFPAGSSSTAYSYLACNTTSNVGNPSGFASQHTIGAWVRGVNGGEQIRVGACDNNFSTFPTKTVVTLTTSWQYVENLAVLADNNEIACALIGVEAGPMAQQDQYIELCWPNFK